MMVVCDVHPIEEQAIALLLRIARAPTQFEAIRLECGAQSLMRVLEARDELSASDVDNLLVVFQSALEKRLYELTLH